MDALPCPACRGELRFTEPSAARCARCGGLWLSPAALSKKGARLGSDLVAAASDAPRDCPSCRTPMTAYRSPLVEIDSCETCTGTFLDRGELEILVHAHRPSLTPRTFRCESCERELPRGEAIIGAEQTLCRLCAERAQTLHAPDRRRQTELERRRRNRAIDDAIAQNRSANESSSWFDVGGAVFSVVGFVIEVIFDFF
ncbi:MAG: zf-TFIIB domain-containing protein [Deltaproteobacteria bacterium]|nr:zf-TFIIB domain-containing protein [Deltaproteobacteria bacterium]